MFLNYSDQISKESNHFVTTLHEYLAAIHHGHKKQIELVEDVVFKNIENLPTGAIARIGKNHSLLKRCSTEKLNELIKSLDDRKAYETHIQTNMNTLEGLSTVGYKVSDDYLLKSLESY